MATPEQKPKSADDMTAQFDQMDAHLNNVAAVMGSYYQSLIKGGAPHDLACQLVREYHFALMCRPIQANGPVSG